MSTSNAPGPSAVAHDVAAPAASWYQGLQDAISPPPPPLGTPPAAPPSSEQQAIQSVQRVQMVTSSVANTLYVVQGALDAGFAELTAPIAALFPAVPAATLAMPYLGVPHTHTHPPSLNPPAPPVPLPSIGTVMFGCHVRTMVNGMPAARAGDLGLAPTCGGFAPYFEIVTGSSNVFIGGVRAARMGDFCKVCIPPDPEPTSIPAGKFMAAVGAAARGTSAAIGVAGLVAPVLSIAGDAMEADEAVDDDAAMAAAEALSAAMQAADLAANLVRQAIANLMGKDPGTPNLGNVLLGHPNVLIGGFPMINIPNPAEALLAKLSRYRGASSPNGGKGEGPAGPC